MILGDGIFEKMKNKEILKVVWNRIMKHESGVYKSVHEMTGDATSHLLNEVLQRDSTDNLTGVIIGLNGITRLFNSNEAVANNSKTVQQQSKSCKSIPVAQKTEASKEDKLLLMSRFIKPPSQIKPLSLVGLNSNKQPQPNTVRPDLNKPALLQLP